MANYAFPRNPDGENFNQFQNADIINGQPDGRDDAFLGWRLYRVHCVMTATGVLTVIAPSTDGNLSDTVTLAAATTDEIDLHAALATYLFPANVMRGPAYLRPMVDFDVVTSPVAEVGDTGDPNALVTSSAIDSAGYVTTVAAAQYATRIETAFIPTLTLGSGAGNLSTMTAGALEVGIFYAPLPV